jgi:single-strand DNA-binding protein
MVNRITLLGGLGQDPTLKYTPNGAAVCTFSLATSESWTDKNGDKQSETQWHNIVVWGKQAESCNQYLKKGSKAYIEGKLVHRSYDDKEGNKRYISEIKATTVQFLSSGGDKSQSPKNDSKPQQEYKIEAKSEFTADSIPF